MNLFEAMNTAVGMCARNDWMWYQKRKEKKYVYSENEAKINTWAYQVMMSRYQLAWWSFDSYTTSQVDDYSRSSPFISLLGLDESRESIAIDWRDRGEYSAESLLSDDE
jgi:hypothetical protein